MYKDKLKKVTIKYLFMNIVVKKSFTTLFLHIKYLCVETSFI